MKLTTFPKSAHQDARGNNENTDGGQEEPAFLNDEGLGKELLPHITTKNIRKMCGWQSDEILEEAIARRDAKAG